MQKHAFTLLRPIDGAVCQRKECCAFTSNRWRCVSKKHVVPLRPIDGAVVPKKACFYLYLPQV
jgi:hypothetical protein